MGGSGKIRNMYKILVRKSFSRVADKEITEVKVKLSFRLTKYHTTKEYLMLH
jgi:hypothetical protein